MTIVHLKEISGCGCDRQDVTDRLLSIDDAVAKIDAATAPIEGVEELDLLAARGRILAGPVVCEGPVPRFDNSAMDGYALNLDALEGEGPWSLCVNDCVAAGGPVDVEHLRTAATQIFTGAPIPYGADAVVPQESVQRTGDTIVLDYRPQKHAHIRRAGEDMAQGRLVVPTKRRLGPCEIAACAAAGVAKVRVRRRLSVAILSTGNEVRQAGANLSGAQISDVNTPMLASMMGSQIELVDVSHCADDLSALTEKLTELETKADLIITTGGISVGAADHMKSAISTLGGQIVFSGVAMKPGKPVTFGRLGQSLWLGLPGNPVSAFTTWKQPVWMQPRKRIAACSWNCLPQWSKPTLQKWLVWLLQMAFRYWEDMVFVPTLSYNNTTGISVFSPYMKGPPVFNQ